MSLSIVDKVFNTAIKSTFKATNFDFSPDRLKVSLVALGIVSTAHIIYSSILTTKTIQVARKYMMHTKTGTSFMIIDTEGNHYEVPVSIRHWQWNVQELYDSFREGIQYEIKYFGKRIPVLGTFPCIVGAPRPATF